MVARKITHLSVEEREARGAEARTRTPVSSHTKWRPVTDRPDPVALLEEQNRTREPDLVPVRHGRMMASPFTFYRGAAKIMAADLKDTPVAGLDAQLCGDAHLSNFGVFASPERRLLFDLNDFDETLPGPFEYDVKRMAASFTIAGRFNGFSAADANAATLAAVAAYRKAMTGFAAMGTMDLWYAHLDEDEIMTALRATVAEVKHAAKGSGKGAKKREKLTLKAAKRAEQTRVKARTRDSLQALSKLGEFVDGRTGSSASRRSSCRCATWPPRTACRRTRSTRRSASSSAPIGPPCRTTGATCSSASRSWTRPARWSAWGAWEPARSSSCWRDGTNATRSSCRSRRPRRPFWRLTYPRAGIASTANGWCRASG